MVTDHSTVYMIPLVQFPLSHYFYIFLINYQSTFSLVYSKSTLRPQGLAIGIMQNAAKAINTWRLSSLKHSLRPQILVQWTCLILLSKMVAIF